MDNKICEEVSDSEPVRAVYGMLRNILELYVDGECYNRLPDTDNYDGARDYFSGLIGDARKRLATEFLGRRDDEVCQKLGSIIDETETFVMSCSVPGVVERWRDINPRLNYFDCVFDIIEEEGMETARFANRLGRLAFFPSARDIKARKAYFAERATQYAGEDPQSAELRLFRDELLLTLTAVFGHDFGEETSRVT